MKMSKLASIFPSTSGARGRDTFGSLVNSTGIQGVVLRGGKASHEESKQERDSQHDAEILQSAGCEMMGSCKGGLKRSEEVECLEIDARK